MILYTPIAWEDVFPSQESPWSILWRQIDGRPCLIRHDADGSEKVERLLSTNPFDFLDPRFQPNSPI